MITSYHYSKGWLYIYIDHNFAGRIWVGRRPTF